MGFEGQAFETRLRCEGGRGEKVLKIDSACGAEGS